MPEWILSKRVHRGYTVTHIKTQWFRGATPRYPQGSWPTRTYWYEPELDVQGDTFKEVAEAIDRRLDASNTGIEQSDPEARP